MEKEKIKSPFDLSNVCGVSNYVKYWIDQYQKDPRVAMEVREKLKVIFSSTSKYQIKVLYGNDFSAVFHQRLGKRRLQTLKRFLCDMEKDRYGNINWS